MRADDRSIGVRRGGAGEAVSGKAMPDSSRRSGRAVSGVSSTPRRGQLRLSHSSHWGAFEAVIGDDHVLHVDPHPLDPAPSALLRNIPSALSTGARIRRPAIRKGWLNDGPGPDSRRGSDPFVEVSWDELLDLLASELRRVYGRFGASSVYGGSYGWASAGRFHHAQSQLHRFLNGLGGYVRSVNTYSSAAAEVLFPHIVGTGEDVIHGGTSWSAIRDETELVVAFGGLPPKNLAVASGGITRHSSAAQLRMAAVRGTRFVLLSPLRSDMADELGARWLPLRPGTDVAVMLALAHTLVARGWYDRAFIQRYTNGFERFARYLMGDADGISKDPEWAARISGLDAATLTELALEMAERRTFITVTWSLQRADHGEQPPWMGLVLACLLGQIGLPGGGFGHGYGSMADTGAEQSGLPLPTLEQGTNPVREFIPVARIADMLLGPGSRVDYDGQTLTYPDIRLVYWSGGNPFHHHQHTSRLRRAMQRPDTIVVHDPYWTATARHADIVVPSTTSLERADIGAARRDLYLMAMRQVSPPSAEARDDFDVFGDLASELGTHRAFTENRTSAEWLPHLYERWRAEIAGRGTAVPAFDQFWRDGFVRLPSRPPTVFLSSFRSDPDRFPLHTPSGRIEIFSSVIDAFGYDDCPGQPAWLEPAEWLGGPLASRYPLHLIANQPRTRLHSQLDMGEYSQSSKVAGREPLCINPTDALARGIADGDVVRVFNDRGSCLAGAVVTSGIRAGVVQLSTGAWYDPLDPSDVNSMCVHGSVNVLTYDKGTSRLAQGNCGQHALVEIERYGAVPPPVRAHEHPRFVSTDTDPRGLS